MHLSFLQIFSGARDMAQWYITMYIHEAFDLTREQKKNFLSRLGYDLVIPDQEVTTYHCFWNFLEFRIQSKTHILAGVKDKRIGTVTLELQSKLQNWAAKEAVVSNGNSKRDREGAKGVVGWEREGQSLWVKCFGLRPWYQGAPKCPSQALVSVSASQGSLSELLRNEWGSNEE